DLLLRQKAASLSAGERRLVALARVLLRRAPLLILDEPEANLDMNAAARVLAVLRESTASQRMLILTHDPRFAALADRALEFRHAAEEGLSVTRVAEAAIEPARK